MAGPNHAGGHPARPVYCQETEERYSSVAEAARQLGVHKSSIQSSLKWGYKIKGFHFLYCDASLNPPRYP
eukprot:g7549.t1